MNHTTCRADITIEDVVFENDGALIAFDHERSHILHGWDCQVIIPLLLRMNHLLKEVASWPKIFFADFELNILPIFVGEIKNHGFIVKLVEFFCFKWLVQEDFLNIGDVTFKRRLFYLNRAWNAVCVQYKSLV